MWPCKHCCNLSIHFRIVSKSGISFCTFLSYFIFMKVCLVLRHEKLIVFVKSIWTFWSKERISKFQKTKYARTSNWTLVDILMFPEKTDFYRQRCIHMCIPKQNCFQGRTFLLWDQTYVMVNINSHILPSSIKADLS